MKTLATMASIAVATCVVLSSAGVFAEDPHNTTNPTGQPGTAATGGVSCSTYATPPGHSASSMGSPYSGTPPNYSGQGSNPTASVLSGGKGVGNPMHSISEYDVACFQQSSRLGLVSPSQVP
jgi:hypothetical protein